MPFFIANFGDTLDGLGESNQEETTLETVESFIILFVIIGAIAGCTGFTMVTTWSIAGERQVNPEGAPVGTSCRLEW